MIGAILCMSRRTAFGWLVLLLGSIVNPAFAQDMAASSPDGTVSNSSTSASTSSSTFASNSSSSLSVSSHNPEKVIRPLSIGDKVPDIEFENVLNNKNNKVRLSDFKGKLVILDMWSTTCTACIGAFSKMQSLQEEFKGKVQILLVNPHVSKYDTEDKIMSVLEKLKARTGFCPSLPIPIHDSILNSYFPHQSVPHVVWIDAAGTVTAITGSLDVTNENINSILQKQDINMPVKNDWAFNTEKPLLIDENGGADNDFVFRSLFTKYKGGIGFKSGVRLNNNKEVVGVYMLNKSLRQYIDEAYSDVINGINYNRFVFEVKDPTRFSESFNRENIYCYDLTVAPTAMQKFDVSAFLKEDLKRAFNISVQKSTRKLKCIAITATDKIKRHFSKYDVRQVDLSVSSIRKYMHHVSIEEAIKYIDRFDAPLVLDDTGITGNIDINFPENINLSNRLDILSFLRKIGFHVKEEERELSVIIITDK